MDLYAYVRSRLHVYVRVCTCELMHVRNYECVRAWVKL